MVLPERWGGGAVTRGETRDARGKTERGGAERLREGARKREGGLGRGEGCSRHPPPGTSGMWTLASQAPYLCGKLQAPPRWMQTTPSY